MRKDETVEKLRGIFNGESVEITDQNRYSEKMKEYWDFRGGVGWCRLGFWVPMYAVYQDALNYRRLLSHYPMFVYSTIGMLEQLSKDAPAMAKEFEEKLSGAKPNACNGWCHYFPGATSCSRCTEQPSAESAQPSNSPSGSSPSSSVPSSPPQDYVGVDPCPQRFSVSRIGSTKCPFCGFYCEPGDSVYSVLHH
jgi:hypothetical protein